MRAVPEERGRDVYPQVRRNRESLHFNARHLQVSLGEASRWVARNTEPDATVAAGSIGYVGFYADRHVIDLVGLVEPAIAYANHAGNVNYWYETHKPDYAIRRMKYQEQLGTERYRVIACTSSNQLGQRMTAAKRLFLASP